MLAASVFNIRKQNVGTDDLDHPGYMKQTGEMRARGLELEAKTSLGRQLDVIASHTFLDAKVTRSTDASALGKQPAQTARNTSKLWLDYRFAGEALQGWSLGGGVRHTGRVAAVDDNSYWNPARTLLDAALRLQQGPMSLALNASNLLDTKIIANRGQFYGQGRTLLATLSYRW